MGQPKDSEFKDRDTMTLDLDDGGKLECIVLNVFPVNNREYIALLPMNDEGHVEEDAQIFLYRFEELGDDEVNLETTSMRCSMNRSSMSYSTAQSSRSECNRIYVYR